MFAKTKIIQNRPKALSQSKGDFYSAEPPSRSWPLAFKVKPTPAMQGVAFRSELPVYVTVHMDVFSNFKHTKKTVIMHFKANQINKW